MSRYLVSRIYTTRRYNISRITSSYIEDWFRFSPDRFCCSYMRLRIPQASPIGGEAHTLNHYENYWYLKGVQMLSE